MQVKKEKKLKKEKNTCRSTDDYRSNRFDI